MFVKKNPDRRKKKIIHLLLPSAAEILDFIASLSALSEFNDFLQDYDFVMIIMGDFTLLKNLPNNHFIP